MATGALRSAVRLMGDERLDAISGPGGRILTSDGQRLAVFEADGFIGWRRSEPGEKWMSAALGETAVAGREAPACGSSRYSLQILDVISGKTRPSPGATARGRTLAPEGEDLFWVAEPPHGSDRRCGNGEHHLFRVHHPSGVTLRQTPVGIPGAVEVWPTDLYLTESDTLQLFSLARGTSHLWTTYLQEFSREGNLLWTCPLIDVGGDSFQTGRSCPGIEPVLFSDGNFM